MNQKTRAYEITIVFSPEEGEEAKKKQEKVIKEIGKIGKITKKESWGEKALAYPIKKYHRGHYYFLIVTAEPEKIKKTDQYLKLEEKVLRYLIINQE